MKAGTAGTAAAMRTAHVLVKGASVAEWLQLSARGLEPVLGQTLMKE